MRGSETVTASAVEAPSRARGNLMILVLALSCFVFGCAYQYILGVPDQVAQIAGIDLSQVSLMMGVYGVCNAVGTPLLVMALTSLRPENLLLVSLALMAVGMAHLRRHPHLSRHFDGPCRHGRGQRNLRSNRLHRGKPHRRPFARRLGHVECGAGLQRFVRLRASRRAHAAQRHHLAAGVLGARRCGMRRVRGHSAPSCACPTRRAAHRLGGAAAAPMRCACSAIPAWCCR